MPLELRDKLTGAGMPAYLAGVIARAKSGTMTSAERISGLGVSGPLAIELAKQIAANNYNVNALVALGMSPAVAELIKAG